MLLLLLLMRANKKKKKKKKKKIAWAGARLANLSRGPAEAPSSGDSYEDQEKTTRPIVRLG